MIVDMQKVAVLSIASEEAALLAELRRLGVLHVTAKEKPERHSKEVVAEKIKTLQGVMNTLLNCPKSNKDPELPAEIT